jgi:addiction module HigA family antidote
MITKMSRKPIHPGKFLREEFLEPHGITQANLAEALQLNRVTVSKILNERQKITPEVAIRLSQCLNTSPDVWLNMQTKLDLWEIVQKKPQQKFWKKIKSFAWLQAHAAMKVA